MIQPVAAFAARRIESGAVVAHFQIGEALGVLGDQVTQPVQQQAARAQGLLQTVMPPDVARVFIGLGLNLLQGYGMTENLAVSNLTLEGRNQEGTVGPPYPGVEVRIDATTGEIQMRSPAVMQGYYKEPEQTATAITAAAALAILAATTAAAAATLAV